MRFRSQLVVALLLLASCKGETKFSPASFPRFGKAEVRLIGEAMETNLPLDLCVDENSICVLAHTPTYWLHIYDRETGQLLSESLPVGRGPGEAVNVMSMDYNREKQVLYVHSPNLHKSVLYRFDGSSGKMIFEGEIQHPQEGVIRHYHLLSDGRFLYEGYMPDDDRFTRFFMYEDGVKTTQYQDYPGIEREEDKYCFLMSNGKSDPESGKFVFGTLYGAVLECFDLSDGVFNRTGLRLLDPPRIDMSAGRMEIKKGTKWGFSTFCPTSKCIYSNYIGSDNENDFSAVSVFGWDGKEKACFETGHNILRMSIDPDRRDSLYVIISSEEQKFSLARVQLIKM